MKNLYFPLAKQDSHINDPKLSDGGARRGLLRGWKAAVVEQQA